MFVDSHCHLSYEDFGVELDQVIERAKEARINTLLTICTKLEEMPALLDVSKRYPHVFCTVGIHPHDALQALLKYSQQELITQLKKYEKEPKVVGIGEAGLDYYYENSPKESQIKCFEAHIEAAIETGLPLSIHTRDAEKDTIDLLTKEAGKVRGVIHCFSGSQWLANQALDLGFYISLSGIVTFKNAESLRETVKTIPLNRLLLETDAPFLAPPPHRGKRNEPSFIEFTAKVVADLKKVSLEKIAEVTTQNFFDCFPKAYKS